MSSCKAVGSVGCVQWIVLPFRRRGQAVHAYRRPSVPPEDVLLVVHKKKKKKRPSAVVVKTSSDSSISLQHNKLASAETKRKTVVVVQDDGEFIKGLFGACSNNSSSSSSSSRSGTTKVPAKTTAGCSRTEDTAKTKGECADHPGGDGTKGPQLQNPWRSERLDRQHSQTSADGSVLSCYSPSEAMPGQLTPVSPRWSADAALSRSAQLVAVKARPQSFSGAGPRRRSTGEKRAVILNADMSEDMQRDAVAYARESLEQYTCNTDIAAFIKKEFDKKYKTKWHCIVGRNFGSFVTHETNHFIYFYIGQIAVLLFKAG